MSAESSSYTIPLFYRKVRALAEHRRAAGVLYVASFAESIISPVLPDFLLAPMSVAQPHAAWRFAFWTTLASVLGALVGYGIGAYFMLAFGNELVTFYQLDGYVNTFTGWLREWGALVILICAVSPIPYKSVALTSGIAGINPVLFVVISLIGRGARFFAVAAVCKKWGGAAEDFLLQKIIGTKESSLVSLILAAVLIVLAGAFFFEYVLGLAPCDLCLQQRVPYYIAAGITFVALASFNATAQRWAAIFCVPLFLVSAGLGGNHFGIELGLWEGFAECAGAGAGGNFATSPQDFMAQLETAQLQDCSTPLWSLFGITLAGYNMFISLGLASFLWWKLK